MDHGLIDRRDSCLIVIDVQQHFLNKLPTDWRDPLVARIAWLVKVARALEVPIVATAEDISAVGPLVPELMKELPEDVTIHDKLIFGLAGQPSILDDVKRKDRTTLVLAGLETDVCVAHSAIGLRKLGYRVTVIEDASASPPPHHEAGLRRIGAAGAIITDTKGIYYEWVRDLATLSVISQKIGTDLPPGLTL